MPIKTMLIGAGNIAGAKKKATKNGPIVTHIHAIISDKRFRLAGIVDNAIGSAFLLAKKWNVWPEIPIAASLKSMFENHGMKTLDNSLVDLVVIATPPKTHLDIVKQVFECSRPLMILLEKPGGSSIQEALEISRLCAENDCKLFLNYQRNYSPELNISMIKTTIGKVQSARCDYVRGLMNDASHAIALFQKWFGTQNLYDNKATVFGPKIDDLPGDATISASYSLPDCPDVILCGHNGRLFDAFEITLFGERGVLHFEDHGQSVVLDGITDEETYGEYKKLWHNRTKLGRANLSLANVYDAIAANVRLEHAVDYVNIWWTISQIANASLNKK